MLRSRGGRFEFQQAQNLLVEAFGRERHGYFINVADVGRGNDAFFGDVAEQRDLGFQVGAERAVAAADQNIGLDADAQQFLHAVLRGFGFQFAGGGDERHKREVSEDDIFRAQLEAHLANRFHEGQ